MIGFSNSWTMPIKGRIDMLSTGIRTPIGVKVFGPDLTEIGRILSEVEATLRTVRGTRSAFAERVSQGYYLDFDVNREAIARYGLSVMDVEDTIHGRRRRRKRHPTDRRSGAVPRERPIRPRTAG